MTEMPPSPKAARLATPRWLDTRLVLGVLLVLVSVVVGARVLASADHSQSVWVLTRDLPAGATLTEADLQRSQVRLFDGGNRYVVADAGPPVGYLLRRGVGSGELLPQGSLARPGQQGEQLRDVSVPVEPGHLPADLRDGQLVDVYLTTAPPDGAGQQDPNGSPGAATTAAPTNPVAGSTAAPVAGSTAAPLSGSAGGTGLGTAAPGTTSKLLARVPVRLRPDATGRGDREAVVLQVSDADAAVLVTALRTGSLDLARARTDVGLEPLSPTPPTG